MATTEMQPRAQTVAEQAANFRRQPAAYGEMRERKEPRFIKFADGEVLTGVLMSIERATVKGKPATRFLVIEEESREPAVFLGTFQLESQLLTSDIGHRVEIRCEGTNPNVTKNGNAMKVFKIFVSEKPVVPGRVASAEDLSITDEDIPF